MPVTALDSLDIKEGQPGMWKEDVKGHSPPVCGFAL